MRPKIGITLGDVAGIGPEIVLKALVCPELKGLCRPVVIGHLSVLEHYRKILGHQIFGAQNLGVPPKLKPISSPEELLAEQDEAAIPVVDFSLPPLDDIVPGQPQARTGEAAIIYIKQAVALVQSGYLAAMTTTPISKWAIAQAGYKYPGHTELLAELTNAKIYAMMLVGGPLKVVLATTHCALSEVPGQISQIKLMELIQLIHRELPRWGVPNPRIAVAGLNPHAGEKGMFGREEEERIRPAVAAAKSLDIDVIGPLPADTLFYRVAKGMADVVLAMYHDQGLIPLKLLAFRQAVNITLGLPVIRTSVGHGCATDIAGRGSADPTSLLEAVRLAAQAATLPW